MCAIIYAVGQGLGLPTSTVEIYLSLAAGRFFEFPTPDSQLHNQLEDIKSQYHASLPLQELLAFLALPFIEAPANRA